MDAFERIVGQVLLEEGFWVEHSVKVELTHAEKAAIQSPSTPRPEIDLVAYNVRENRLYLIEAKSFLDSHGVNIKEVICEDKPRQAGRYKIFTSKTYRDVVMSRLREMMLESGKINSDTELTIGLVAGNVYRNQEEELSKEFVERGWFFRGPTQLFTVIESLVLKGYENNEVTIAAKIIFRGLKRKS